MLGIAVLEYYSSLIKYLRWWNIFLLLVISYLLATFNVYENNLFFKIYFLIIVGLAVRPKLNRLNYLLPGDNSSRSRYLQSTSLGILLFFILWFSLIYIFELVIYHVVMAEAIKSLICTEFLLILILTPFVVVSSCLSNKKIIYSKQMKSKTKMIIILLIYPIIHIIALSRFINGYGYVISTVISYLCTILYYYIMLSGLKQVDINYESFRKPFRLLK